MKTIIILSTALFTTTSYSLTADEIVKKSNLASYYSGDDGKSYVKMDIKDSQGRKRKRELIILRKDLEEGGKQLFYLYFRKPSDVRKMVFLVHKNIKTDDFRWLYLPALDLVKRIAASDKRTSFVGSNFFYEDVSGRSVNEDKHELINTTDNSYIVKNTPVNPDSVEFSFYTVEIDKKTYLPLKAVYTDKNGKEYRIAEVLSVENIKGFATVTKSRIKNLVSGSETVISFSKVKYNLGLKKKIFTERYLRKVPRIARK
ncbi:MAG: outer membrane lipoprotein-sorting protein [Deltaproteobacteria bacterium]|nr:outer membrane lipoprotein-sorting protein [Deltaproteobacteria bacterium]